MMEISHALVLPDDNFNNWLAAARPYTQKFERVALVRSPAGNDLNRFTNVSAVQAPGVWINNDALGHIRRAYPSVVRVDVISAQTPQQLTNALQTRINNNDRYGERQTNPKHIFDRFVLNWPTDFRPASITRPYSDTKDSNPDTHEGFDIATTRGAKVLAAAPGKVTAVLSTNDRLNYGPYVQITSVLEGETYVVTQAGLQNITVRVGQDLKAGDEIAQAAGDAIKVVVQNPPKGTNEFSKLPHVANPILMVHWPGLRVYPVANGLRIRRRPTTTGEIITEVGTNTALEPAEIAGRTLAKVGVDGQWLRLRYPGERDAYTAAWLVEARGERDNIPTITGIPMLGINIDIDHPQGRPDPNAIKRLGWVRLKFNVSLNPNVPQGNPSRHGNTDVNFTFNRYLPILQNYVRAGLRVIMVFTHQTFGEGQGYVWPEMHTERWRDLTSKYAEVVRQSVARFAGTNLIHAYQIWNEPDTDPRDARAAVPIPPADYGFLLSETIKAIRRVDTQTPLLTGGLVSGPEKGAAYIREAFAAMPGNIRPTGIAFHPYGQGDVRHEYTIHGSIGRAVGVFRQVLPGRPVWITEWGVLNAQGNDGIAGNVDSYARGFLSEIRNTHPGQVATACWYAWADGMDNGYGLVRSDGSPRPPLYTSFLG